MASGRMMGLKLKVLPWRGWPRRQGFWGRNALPEGGVRSGAVAQAGAPILRCWAGTAPKTKSGLGAQRRNLARPEGTGQPMESLKLKAWPSIGAGAALKLKGALPAKARAALKLKLKGTGVGAGARATLKAKGQSFSARPLAGVSQEGGPCSTPLWKYIGER
ncbi:MAG: hypothetical protein ABJQ14_12845 [Hyphomicrobiales bacterium]